MATNILQSLLSADVFKITPTTGGSQIAPKLQVKKVSMKLPSALMRHIQEDGTTLCDCRIIHPSTLTVEAYCPDLATVKQINALLQDRSQTYTIESKGLLFKNMMLDSEQVNQSAQVMSAMPITMTFKKVLAPGLVPVTVSQTTDASLVDRGMAALSQAKTSVTNLYNSVAGAL